MAAKGWLLQSTGGLMLTFHFRKGEAARMRYALDYQEKDTPEYRQLLGDVGWQLLGASSGWLLWGQAYHGERPQIYSDMDGLIQRNQRVLTLLTAVFAVQLPLGTAVMATLHNRNILANVLLAVWAVFIAVQAGVVVGVSRNLAKMKRRKDNM